MARKRNIAFNGKLYDLTAAARRCGRSDGYFFAISRYPKRWKLLESMGEDPVSAFFAYRERGREVLDRMLLIYEALKERREASAFARYVHSEGLYAHVTGFRASMHSLVVARRNDVRYDAYATFCRVIDAYEKWCRMRENGTIRKKECQK